MTSQKEKIEWLNSLLMMRENERLEFKQAQASFDVVKLERYCCALANEGGGDLLLGITEKPTPHVTGTQAFPNPEKLLPRLVQLLRLKVQADEILHPDGRVLVFHVPPHSPGIPVAHNGAYLMRGGEGLTAMTPDRLKRIFDELNPDYTAQPAVGTGLNDLLPSAIEEFRRRWMKKSGNAGLETLSTTQLLSDAELLVDGTPTIAALVLFGTRAALTRHLAQAELVFEYRSTDASGPAGQRIEYREGFFAWFDDLWKAINNRNELQHYQDGLFILDLPTFNERVIREAILNAVSHRDYRHPSSIFVRQYPKRMEIVSPGGFPDGITVDNLLWRQLPRNRRLADSFGRCGLVERSGQGFNIIYEQCIRESRPRPSFDQTDQFQVALSLSGEIQDARFLQFLEKIGVETLRSFSTADFLLVDEAYHGNRISAEFLKRARALQELGILEKVEGSRNQFILSRKFHAFLGKKGTYTRKKGLDRETNKALLLKHIKSCGEEGCKFDDFIQVLPALSRRQIQRLLAEMQKTDDIIVQGKTKAARWYSGSK